ncbi:late competence development ComFB family protein [Spirochaetota bacterium]
MDIHNLMEDLVFDTVDELFETGAKSDSDKWCTCRQCRMDVACYALNRLKPEYVLSGRGLAYSEVDYGEKLQRIADVAALVKKGWAIINAAPRPSHNKEIGRERLLKNTSPVFNIKPIMGRLFNGENFEPVYDCEVALMDELGLVSMMDNSWTNPYTLVKNTNGLFTFWPYPVASSEAGESRRFPFTITASLDGFENLTHYFELDLVSEQNVVLQFSKQTAFRLPDLYIFPK